MLQRDFTCNQARGSQVLDTYRYVHIYYYDYYYYYYYYYYYGGISTLNPNPYTQIVVESRRGSSFEKFLELAIVVEVEV
jgi:hypothetical protein